MLKLIGIFQCSMVSQNLRKEYLNLATFERPALILIDKELDILIFFLYGTPSYVIIFRKL